MGATTWTQVCLPLYFWDCQDDEIQGNMYKTYMTGVCVVKTCSVDLDVNFQENVTLASSILLCLEGGRWLYISSPSQL